jgi:phage gpG-like protein
MSNVVFPSTTRLNFEWVEPGETPASVEYKLMKIRAIFDNPYMIAEEAKAILREDMQNKFDDESDPSGNKWQELVKPEPMQRSILQRGSTDSAMFTAIMDRASWSATRVGVFLDTSAWPPYWPHHEQPDREGYRIPQREFIAATNEAELEIVNFADFWLNEQVYEVIHEPAPVGVFGKGGRMVGVMGQTTMIGGVARREVKDPATGQFVSTRPEFYM